jgi:hypothetical protein
MVTRCKEKTTILMHYIPIYMFRSKRPYIVFHLKLQKGYTRLVAASDKVYQLLAHGLA